MSKGTQLALLLMLVLFANAQAQERTAEEWLGVVDSNMAFEAARYTATMTIHLPDGQERMFKMDCKVVGEDKALIEYSEPPRDRGTRYLKRDDNLWIYFPRVDRTMQIKGHMLRQGVQGGEMSYEDMTESQSWKDKYRAAIVAETDSTVQLRLTAHDMTVSYPYRDVTIEKESEIARTIVNYDASENPIKQTNILEVQQFGDRMFPVKTEMVSLLTENKWTRFEMSGVDFNVQFEDDLFTKRALVKY